MKGILKTILCEVIYRESEFSTYHHLVMVDNDFSELWRMHINVCEDGKIY